MIFPKISQFFLASGLLKLDYFEKISSLEFHSFIQRRFIDHILCMKHITILDALVNKTKTNIKYMWFHRVYILGKQIINTI